MTRTRSILLAITVVSMAAFVLAGCDKHDGDEANHGHSHEGGEAPKAEAVKAAKAPKAGAAATATAAPAKVAAAEHAGHDHGHDHAHKEGHGAKEAPSGCAAESSGKGPASEPVAAGETPLGQAILHGGTDFSDAPEVAVQDLLADPDKWAGKAIKLSGDVSAMCHHRRGWFALVAGDKSGQQIRVLTMPNFKVPAGSIGRSARAEGLVEVIEVPAQHAKHLMKDHKLGDPAAVKGATQKQIVLRATAADFIDLAAK